MIRFPLFAAGFLFSLNLAPATICCKSLLTESAYASVSNPKYGLSLSIITHENPFSFPRESSYFRPHQPDKKPNLIARLTGNKALNESRQSLITEKPTQFDHWRIEQSPNIALANTLRVDSISEILSLNLEPGQVILVKSAGARYIVREEKISGYQTDTAAVVPTANEHYAVYSPKNNIYKISIWGAIADGKGNTPDNQAFINAFDFLQAIQTKNGLADSQRYLHLDSETRQEYYIDTVTRSANRIDIITQDYLANVTLSGQNNTIYFQPCGKNLKLYFFNAKYGKNLSFKDIKFESWGNDSAQAQVSSKNSAWLSNYSSNWNIFDIGSSALAFDSVGRAHNIILENVVYDSIQDGGRFAVNNLSITNIKQYYVQMGFRIFRSRNVRIHNFYSKSDSLVLPRANTNDHSFYVTDADNFFADNIVIEGDSINGGNYSPLQFTTFNEPDLVGSISLGQITYKHSGSVFNCGGNRINIDNFKIIRPRNPTLIFGYSGDNAIVSVRNLTVITDSLGTCRPWLKNPISMSGTSSDNLLRLSIDTLETFGPVRLSGAKAYRADVTIGYWNCEEPAIFPAKNLRNVASIHTDGSRQLKRYTIDSMVIKMSEAHIPYYIYHGEQNDSTIIKNLVWTNPNKIISRPFRFDSNWLEKQSAYLRIDKLDFSNSRYKYLVLSRGNFDHKNWPKAGDQNRFEIIQAKLNDTTLSLPASRNLKTLAASGQLTEAKLSPQQAGCMRRSNNWRRRYSKMQHYIPEAHDPVVTIHCNLIIWQNDEGTTNFQDTPEHRERLYNYFHHPTLGLNFQFYQRYSPPTDPIIPPEEEVHYKNVRFQLEGIYFIRNTQLSKSIGIADKRRYLQANGYEDLLDEVNINITTAPGPVPGAWGHAQYPSYGDQVPMITTTDNPNQKSYAGQPSKQDAGYPVSRATFDGKEYYRDWSFMEHIAHELGHCLDLKHVYAGKVGMGYEACRIRDPEYMPDIFPANAPWCDNPRSGCDVCLQYSDDTPADARPDDGHTNNLMNGRGGRYLSPLQLGKIHRALALKSIGRAASGYSNRPVVIDSDETWDFPLQLYRPVRIDRKSVV